MPRPAGPAYGSRELTLGTDGLDTWELQIKLIGWGSGSDNDGIGQLMDPVKVHGTFDATTADAVKRFQKAHGLSVTGVVNGQTFRAIDRELVEHPISLDDLRCPCVKGVNDGPILCRCPNHPNAGKCTGFGKKRFAGKFLLDGTPLAAEKLAVYDMEEYDGVDKAVIWAVRALMHRARLSAIKVVAGYRCWHDNYHAADAVRWHHRRSTLHLGKTIEFMHARKCVEKKKAPCAECERIRRVALAMCGYQLRWLELDRVVIGEGAMDAAPPTTPFAVHVDTALLKNREASDYVKTDSDAAKPLYTGAVGLSLPVDLGEGRDPKVATTTAFYDNVEKASGGLFPVGKARIWHTGIHLQPAKNSTVYAMCDGEVVACRVGEAESTRPFGSRNFVLLKHMWKGKAVYSLYMHLDKEGASDKSEARWRRQLHLKSKDHVEALETLAFHNLAKNRFSHSLGIDAGDHVETTGAELDPRTLDPTAPTNSKVVKLKKPNNTYVYTQIAGKAVGKLGAADAALAEKIKKAEVIGLEKTIKVHAGEALGAVAKAPKDPSLAPLGRYVHLEMFSEDNLLTSAGYTQLDATDGAKVADRKEITKALVAAHLLSNPIDGVLADTDIEGISTDPHRGRFRSAVLKMESAWSLKYKDAFTASTTFSFMKNADRDALGDAFQEYAFWADAKAAAKGSMPAAPVVHHYHPIVLLLQMAYSP
jgi:hypothetical protein